MRNDRLYKTLVSAYKMQYENIIEHINGRCEAKDYEIVYNTQTKLLLPCEKKANALCEDKNDIHVDLILDNSERSELIWITIYNRLLLDKNTELLRAFHNLDTVIKKRALKTDDDLIDWYNLKIQYTYRNSPEIIKEVIDKLSIYVAREYYDMIVNDFCRKGVEDFIDGEVVK